MKSLKAVSVFIVLFISATLFAGDIFDRDTDKIVEFKGMKGAWFENSDHESLEQFIKKYSSGLKDVVRLNGKKFRAEKRVFVPYSELYLEYLRSRENSAGTMSSDEFIWPIKTFDRITSTFGRRWSAFHEGIDIPAGRGIPIVAASNGRVVVAKFLDNYGNTVFIEHRDHLFTRYCHASQIIVKEGDLVKKGDVIAYVGSSGNSTGNHLHFEIRYDDFPLNPLDFLPFSPSVKKSQYIKNFE